jgi:exopolyphosphatase / guanosine-5'-triphosphate,3'-diphosphate pyrophosphatase
LTYASSTFERPVAIVDIGSNSVRLVVYSGPRRSPSILFNEKVMAGLGRAVGETGALSEEAQARALGTLKRFRMLMSEMGVARSRVVATAAVRDASNGAAFLERVRAIGIEPEVLSGDTEAVMAGMGVLSAIPGADGIVGDLGGGSLELVDLKDGEVRRSRSLPLGVLRLGPLDGGKAAALRARLAKELKAGGIAAHGAGRPLYLVGGSWRALAKLDMMVREFPLPVTHQYRMLPKQPAELLPIIDTFDRDGARKMSISASRVPTLRTAAMLLDALAAELGSSELVVSSSGIREGLLFDDLDAEERGRDPLIEAVRDAGAKLGRFREHGALLDRWIAPVFNDDAPEAARLRLAACLLSDIAWTAHPDFRAERGLTFALHGNWVGIDMPGRVMMAQALFANFGGGRRFGEFPFASLCTDEQLARATQWGLAMRLGHRLSGGLATGLERSKLVKRNGTVALELRDRDRALLGESVGRRLKTLAQSLGLRASA